MTNRKPKLQGDAARNRPKRKRMQQPGVPEARKRRKPNQAKQMRCAGRGGVTAVAGRKLHQREAPGRAHPLKKSKSYSSFKSRVPASRPSASHRAGRGAGSRTKRPPTNPGERPKRRKPTAIPGGLRDQVEHHKAQYRKSQESLGRSRQELLQTEAALADEREARRQDALSSSGKLQDALSTQKKRLEELKVKYQNEQKAHGELQSRFEELTRLRDEQDKEHAAELRRQQSKLQEQEQVVREHKATLANVERQYEESQSRLSEEKDKTARLEKMIADVQAKLKESDQRMEELRNEHGRVQTELEGYKAEVKKHKATIAEHESTIAKLNAELEEQRKKAIQDEEVRRGLHNRILELKGNIRVFCRVRPFLKSSSTPPVYSYPEHPHNGGIQLKAPETGVSACNEGKTYDFEFDRVFGPQDGQVSVFREIQGLIQNALDGYKVCVFAYGQTGSGKTHTMIGKSMDPTDDCRGMIPRAVEQIFQHSQTLNAKGWQFNCNASFMEIYNEKIHDLLADRKPGQEPESLGLQMRNRANKNLVEVANLITIPVNSAQDVYPLLQKANDNRQVAGTDCNARSSRSHSIFRMFIQGHNSVSQQKRFGVLNLIDLAGSERLKMSGSEGDRMREAQAINKSLACLGDVISAISKKSKHVPFRNSKLTHLLMNCFGGDAKTLMFMNLCPESPRFEESLSTLRFAAKVNDCHIGIARRNISGKKS